MINVIHNITIVHAIDTRGLLPLALLIHLAAHRLDDP